MEGSAPRVPRRSVHLCWQLPASRVSHGVAASLLQMFLPRVPGRVVEEEFRFYGNKEKLSSNKVTATFANPRKKTLAGLSPRGEEFVANQLSYSPYSLSFFPLAYSLFNLF